MTYGAGGVLSRVPRLARKAGFEAVVMGIWMPGDPQETEAAVVAEPYVDGYVVGNEGLSAGATTLTLLFEAFDQPWKTEDGIGPHWGLFERERTPKVASRYVVKGYSPLYAYADAAAPHNCFAPEGWMGCWQGIEIDQNDQTQPQAGASAIRITYLLQPECEQEWAGIYWWDPPGSYWCDKVGGFDLRGWTMLTFWARCEDE